MQTFRYPISLLSFSFFLPLLWISAANRASAQISQSAADHALVTAPLPKSGDILRPALANVTHALSSLNIGKWKTSGDMRSSTQQDADSIQHDIDNTLPELISQADGASSSVAASFAVYRNVDALYDVLLRVAGTARMAASRAESGNLDFALSRLEAARTSLGDGIMNVSKEHDAQLVKLQTAVNAAAAQPQKPPSTTIVNDGPASAPAKPRRKHKAAHPAQPEPVTPPQ